MKPRYCILLAVLLPLAGMSWTIWSLSSSRSEPHKATEDELHADKLNLDSDATLELELPDPNSLEVDALTIPLPSWDENIHELKPLPIRGSQVNVQEVTLDWIAAQQKPDGGWEAVLPADQMKIVPHFGRNGATALALLCFLQTGHTHKQKSRYKEHIDRGLEYLIIHDNQAWRDLNKHIFSFSDPECPMISHALATLALCEAYGSTKEKALLPYAQGAINKIASCQDKKSGGWAVDRTSAPDLVTTGWIVMALQRGVFSQVKVEPAIITEAKAYIDRSNPTSTNRLRPLELAIWGHATILFGATRETPGLAECVLELDTLGFSPPDCHYNFLAYSVMRRWDGEIQRRWLKARQKLTEEIQSNHSPNKGTWPPIEGVKSEYFGNSQLERTCLMYLARELESGSDWRHWTLKDRPNPSVDEPFPL